MCFTGINSYLNNLATSDEQVVKVASDKNSNKNDLISQLDVIIKKDKDTLQRYNRDINELDSQISHYTSEISKVNQLASERRKTARICENNPDCNAALIAFEDDKKEFQDKLESVKTKHSRKSELAGIVEARISKNEEKQADLTLSVFDSKNDNSEAKTAVARKKRNI